MAKEQFRLIDQTVIASRITREYRIDIIGTDHEITVRKWWIDDEFETDSDIEMDEENTEIFKELDEDTQEDLNDFIGDLS